MEYIKRCKVCGHVFCYTDKDLKDQMGNAVSEIFSGIAQIGAATSGSMLNMHMAGSQAERVRNQQIDLNRCPNCRSTDLETITKEELQKITAAEALKNGVDVKINTNASTESLLKRAKIFLEDSDWPTANAYCNAVLDVEPDNAEAYLGKLMAELQVTERAKLADLPEPFEDNENYKKVIRFGNDELLNEILGYIEHIKNENLYKSAKEFLESAKTENDYRSIANKFKELIGYKDSEKISLECFEKAKLIKEENERKAEEEKIATEKKAEEDRIAAEIQKKKTAKTLKIVLPILAIIILVIVLTSIISNVMLREKVGEEGYEILITPIGETITLGNYYGGKDWIVVKRKGTKLLLLSESVVDHKAYHYTEEKVTWEESSIREWLNTDYFEETFNKDEQKMIVNTLLDNKNEPATEDKIFLFSYDEIRNNGMTKDMIIAEYATTFALNKGAGYGTNGGTPWLLRSHGINGCINYVMVDGNYSDDYGYYNHEIGIRPAMWIDLSAVE